MRYAIFTDIHANLEALEAVLAKIDELAQQEPIDQIWFLGDLVGYGPNPNECIDKLRERTDVIIAGNHDWAAVGKIDLEEFSEAARLSALWTAEQLTEEHRTFLANLPERLEKNECLLVHGSPYGPLWEYLTSEVLAERSFQYFSNRYCFIGHTHVPVIFQQPDTVANSPTMPLETIENIAEIEGIEILANADEKIIFDDDLPADSDDETQSSDSEETLADSQTSQQIEAAKVDSEEEQGESQDVHSEEEQGNDEDVENDDTENEDYIATAETTLLVNLDQDQATTLQEAVANAADVVAEVQQQLADDAYGISAVTGEAKDGSVATNVLATTTSDTEEENSDKITPEEAIQQAEERLNEEIEELLQLLGLSQKMISVTNEMLEPPEGHWSPPEGYRAIVNPGGVGQPRDGDARAAFMIYDTKRGFTFYRIPYNIKKTQEKILKAKLPPYLATRLEYGR